MTGLPDDVVAAEDVVVLEFGEGLDLAIEHFPADGVLDALHVDGLDGDDLAWV